MSDDLGISKKFFSEFLTAFFAFRKNFFSYLPKLPIRCANTDHVT